LTTVARYPFAGVEFLMEDGHNNVAPVDLSRFNTVSFVAKCAPANSLTFGITTFDEEISRPGEYLTYPAPLTFFSCNESGVPISLDLNRLTIPQWWFDTLKLELARQSYKLDHVAKIFFTVSQQSPRDLESRVEISQMRLEGRDYRYISGLVVALVSGIALFGAWFVWAYTRALARSLESKIEKDLQFVAYRQLTLEPFKDRGKAALLRYIATHYTDPQLGLEEVVAGSGVSRTKINDVLKSELGMTFTGYLNKLRLTEAARLLSANSSATVAEIAYSVGYASISYFNKLFKEEYGCTPKTFRALAPQDAARRTQEAD